MILKTMILKPTYLVLALLAISGNSMAMEMMSDSALSSVNAADGLAVTAQTDSVSMVNMYSTDLAGTSNSGGVAAADTTYFARQDTVKLTPLVGSSIKLASTLNIGSSAGVPALNLTLLLSPLLFVANKAVICDSSVAGVCNQTLGEVAVALNSGVSAQLTTVNGFLNNAAGSSARVKLLLDDADIFITQKGSDLNRNQLIVSDIRANIDANGKIWVDASDGVSFNGTVTLAPANVGVAGYKAGLQFALKQRANVPVANNYTKQPLGNITRVGASGTINNAKVYLRGINDSTPDSSKGLGRVDGLAAGDSIIGSAGLAINISGQFANSDFSYEIGEAGSGGRSAQFSKLVPFSRSDTTEDAPFTLGNIYLNLIKTQKVGLPISARLASAIKFNTVETSLDNGNGFNYLPMYVNDTVTMTSNPSTALSIRGLNLQALPKVTKIIDNATGLSTKTVNGALLTLVNNANANLILNGMQGDKIGFGIGVSTEGLAADNKSTTIIGLADTTNNLYFGFRNVDFLMQTAGTLDVNGDALRFYLPKLMLAASGELSVGTLMTSSSAKNFSSDSLVANNSLRDVLAGIKFKINAEKVDFRIYPSGATAGLGLYADLFLPRIAGDRLQTGQNTAADPGVRTREAGTFVQFVDIKDQSTLGFENISGRVTLMGINPANPAATVDVSDDSIIVEGKLLINGTRDSAGIRTWGDQTNDLRVGNINFYSGNMNAPQRLGEIAMPGGEIYSKLTLKLN